MGEQGGGRNKHSSLPACHLSRADTSRALGAPRGPQRGRTPAAQPERLGAAILSILTSSSRQNLALADLVSSQFCNRRRTSSYVASSLQTGRSARASKPDGVKELSGARRWLHPATAPKRWCYGKGPYAARRRSCRSACFRPGCRRC